MFTHRMQDHMDTTAVPSIMLNNTIHDHLASGIWHDDIMMVFS